MLKRFVFLALVLMLPATSASATGGRHDTLYLKNRLNAVSLNAVAASRTFTLDTDGWSHATFWVDFTHANNGTLTLTCTGGPEAGDRDYTVSTCTVASGTCTLNDAGVFVTASLSANKKFGFRMGIQGYRDMSCVLAHGGTPAAGDIVTLHVELEAE